MTGALAPFSYLSLAVSLSLTSVFVYGAPCSPVREKEREREKEQKVRACSKHSSFSQSACVIIILNVIVNVCRVVRMMPQLEASLRVVILTAPEVLFIILEL